MILQAIHQWWIWLFHRILISSVSSTNTPGLFVQGNLLRVNRAVNLSCNYNYTLSCSYLCYCDDLCLIFNDCCELKKIQNSTEISMTQNSPQNNGITYEGERLAWEEQISKPLPKHLYACKHDETMEVYYHTVFGCPEEYYDNYVRKNCEQPNKTDKLLHVPVSGVFPNAPKKKSTVKFYNLYCAICHGLTEYTFWDITLACNDEVKRKYDTFLGTKTLTYNSFSKLKNYCNSSFAVPHIGNQRQCQDIIDTCPDDASYVEVFLCTQGPLEPIVSKKKQFKNVDCAFCHNVDRASMVCISTLNHIRDMSGLYKLSIEKCANTSIRDPYGNNTCRRIYTDILDKIEHYITMFGLSLSMLALFVTFCVYASFRPLRNVPGKMSMNLVASMFVANLLFALSNLNAICIVVAVSMHYTYMVSFFWMNAFSFDAWNTFSKTTIGGRSKHCYRYYLAYCWITPLLIVSVSIFVQFTPVDIFPSWMSPKYGPPLCWISNKWALFIFFAAPLFLLVLCNVVFYILTIRAIYRTGKDFRLSKKNKGMFLIYLKLSFIMGINWVFALLHTLTGVTIIRFISVFLNSFQGFWVGCSYLFSKQTWRQLKSKITFLRILKGHRGKDGK